MHNFYNKGSLFIKKLILIIAVFILTLSCNSKRMVEIKIKDKTYKFELAVNEDERRRGLMYRKSLDKNSGMLFVYPREYELSFYMKNTLIPLDIAFIDSNLRVIDIRSMEPLDETPINSKKRAQYALEVNQGFFKNIGLKENDKIEILTPIPFIVE
jgi:hypothetical protein